MKETCKNKIKVLFFISSLAGGGAERVMAEILHHIDKDKIEPVLVLLHPYDDSPYKEYLSKDARVIVVGRRSDSSVDKIKQFFSFIQVIRREKPHVILSMLTHNNIMAILAGIFLRIKVIVSEHSTLSKVVKTKEGRKILWFPVAILVKVLYGYADKIVAVSEGVKIDLQEEFNIPSNKIKVIYNPIDFSLIAELSSLPEEHPFFKEKVPIVIAVGRLVWQKKFDTLIKAFGKVLSKVDARLIILGDGSEKESLKKLIQDMNITDKVFLVGFQKNPYKFLSKADLFVLSSIYEGLPMVILEAMTCGTPVIATDCKSGPREILADGKYGLLVPVGDEDIFSEEIIRLLKDRELREKFSRLGKERVKDFSIEKIIKQYENLIYEIVI